MKKLLTAVLCSLLLAVSAVPAFATTVNKSEVVKVTFTKEPPSECRFIGRQLFEDAMWVTVYRNGECLVSVDPVWADYD